SKTYLKSDHFSGGGSPPPAHRRHFDERKIDVSAKGLLQNELVQRQIGNRLAQPAVLELKVLQALHLLGLQPAELLAPPIIRHLAHPDLADCVRHGLPLRDQNIDLSQLRNNLFRLVSLPCHYSPHDVKDIPQVGPLQWGRITTTGGPMALS